MNGPRGRNKAGLLGFVTVAFAVAGWLFYAHFTRLDFKVNKRPFASLGEFAADELAKIVPSGRIQLVYDVPDGAATKQPRLAKAIEMQAVQAAAFRSRLSTLGKYTFLADVKLARPAMAMFSVWPRDAFVSLLQPPDTTIVLFSSLPSVAESYRRMIDQRPGKLIVVGMSLPGIQSAVDSKLVQLAVAHRIPVPQSLTPSETPAAWVQRVYAVVTPGVARNPN